MQRPRLPQRNPDRWLVVVLVVGLPAIFMLSQGAPVLATALTAVLIGGVVLAVH